MFPMGSFCSTSIYIGALSRKLFIIDWYNKRKCIISAMITHQGFVHET